jgi:TRAP-type mannitol/chloroaromatic compound transport system permease small subunit
MTALADRIDRLVSGIGRVAAWLILVVVLLQFALVVARYLFGLGSIWLSETVIYAHAAVFMLAAAWTLRAEGHVRVDILRRSVQANEGAHRPCSAIVLCCRSCSCCYGCRCPMPRARGRSSSTAEASGLPLFSCSDLIPVFAVLMALQGVAQAIRAVTVLARTR